MCPVFENMVYWH